MSTSHMDATNPSIMTSSSAFIVFSRCRSTKLCGCLLFGMLVASWNTTHSRSTSTSSIQKTSSLHVPCHFERGQGTFTNDDWQWIPQSCADRYHDFVTTVIHKNEKDQPRILPHDENTPASPSLPPRTQPLSIIHIGDSLTYYQTIRLCESGGFHFLPQLYELPNATMAVNETHMQGIPTQPKSNIPINTAEKRFHNINICTNQQRQSSSSASSSILLHQQDEDRPDENSRGAQQEPPLPSIVQHHNQHPDPPFFGLASFRIYGMTKPCMPDLAVRADSRLHATETERVRALFRAEIVDRLFTTDEQTVVILHSTLWDASVGCNDRREIDPEYAQSFLQGMNDMEAVVRELLPRATIYWRSGVPVTESVHQTSWETNRGRNRYAQQTLHSLIEEHAGSDHFLNWWQQVQGIIDEDDGEATYNNLFAEDGMHPHQSLTDAFFNLIMNTIVDQHPHLWSLPSLETADKV